MWGRAAIFLILALAGSLIDRRLNAQVYAIAPANDGKIIQSVLTGSYTVSSLPSPTSNAAKYAFVTDLGGGPDMVLSDGTNWKHIRQGVVTDIAATSSITITPLLSPPIIRLTGTGLTASITLTIAQTNLYAGETFRILFPGTLGTLGSIGISVAGTTNNSISLLGGSWEDLQWNGTALVKIAGGTL